MVRKSDKLTAELVISTYNTLESSIREDVVTRIVEGHRVKSLQEVLDQLNTYIANCYRTGSAGITGALIARNILEKEIHT